MEPQSHESNQSASPSVEIIPTPEDDVIAFTIRTPITPDDFRHMAEILEAAYARHDKIRLFVRLVGPLSWRFEILKERVFHVKREALRHVSHYALVGGPPWLAKIIDILDPLFRVEIRRFESDDEESAWRWLRACGTPGAASALQ